MRVCICSSVIYVAAIKHILTHKLIECKWNCNNPLNDSDWSFICV